MLRACAKLVFAIMDGDFSKMNPKIDENARNVVEYLMGGDDFGCYSNQVKNQADLESNYGDVGDFDELQKFIQRNFVDDSLYVDKVQDAFMKFTEH